VARAGDILTKSGPALASLKDQFQVVGEMIEDSKGTLGDFSSIKSLYIARSNIRVTLDQLEHYNSIPENVKQLKGLLMSDMKNMKSVFNEMVKLESWRDRLMMIVKEQMEMIRNEELGGGNQKGAAAARQKKIQEQMKVIEVMSQRFDTVQELVEFFKRKLWDVLIRTVDFSYMDPSVLVRTLEMIEIRDGSNLRKLEIAKQKAAEEGDEDPDDVEGRWYVYY
jgi:hypothetical protein